MIAGVETRRLAVALAIGAVACNNAPEPPMTATNGDAWGGPVGTWVETFRDDFDGPAGSPPDPSTWNVLVSTNNANNECERYTDSRDNSYLDGAGHLVLKALEVGGSPVRGQCPPAVTYTSARLDTRGHLQPAHGRVEARIRLPAGAGLWPAFWMLGTNGSRWPNVGEIDILEERGSVPGTVLGSVHGPEYFGAGALSRVFSLPSGSFADDDHLFAFEWTSDGMRWLVDEQVYHSRSRASMAALGDTWVFDQPFYLLLNLAVGGNFGGNPTAATAFPSEMTIDYVSVSELQP
jgi:beta-glucanase (GH16 family)